MKVSCLMSTYGRLRCVRDSLACFLDQDWPDRELIILNNHPMPIVFWHPLVRVFNEPKYPTLGHCRNRLLDLAQGDCIRTWDDDDLYLPWSIRQGAESIGNAPAFRPARSWQATGDPPTEWAIYANTFEAAMLIRTDVMRRCGYKEVAGDEHEPIHQEIEKAGGLKQIEFGCATGYAYRWANGVCHISGTLGSKTRTMAERTQDWCDQARDSGDGETPLQPADVRPYWRLLVDAAERKYGSAEAADLKARMGARLQ